MADSIHHANEVVGSRINRGDDQTDSSDANTGWVRRSLSLLLLPIAGVCFWNGLSDRLADDARQAVVADVQAARVQPQSRTPEVSLNTTPIQDIRVGQRVLAHNPEVSKEDRDSWVEPDWSEWQLVRLEMPKPDGGLLKIEMLRPTGWLESQAAVLVESREIIAHPGPGSLVDGSTDVADFEPVPLTTARRVACRLRATDEPAADFVGKCFGRRSLAACPAWTNSGTLPEQPATATDRSICSAEPVIPFDWICSDTRASSR